MSNLWYNNPQILLDDWTEFIPSNDLDNIEKINAITNLKKIK